MAIELKIVWNGTVNGVGDHRLSLAEFSPALARLLEALQRTASNIASLAEDSEHGVKGGRLAEGAKRLDLELASLDDGCVAPTFVCVARVPDDEKQPPLFGDLAERTIDRLVQNIEEEAQGREVNGTVRKFLQSLPVGLTRQSYSFVRDGAVVRKAEFGTAVLPEPVEPLPRMRMLLGSVVGLGFEPGQCFVQIKTDDGSPRFSATPKQVERALALRHELVAVLAVSREVGRLLWIRAATGALPVEAPEARSEQILARWGSLLERLAQ